MKKVPTTPFAGKVALVVLAVLYIGAATLSSWNIIQHSEASTKKIEAVLETYNLKNEGAKALGSYKKEHPILGMLISGPVNSAMKLPSESAAEEALGPEVKALLKSVREESHIAAWWSWFLLSLSLFYVITVVAIERRHDTRPVIFSLTTCSVFFFFIGILAPAMIIWTAPTLPLETGDVSFVMQHQVRGIAAIIWELLTGEHLFVGGFLLLFSIITPLTKASLTFFVTASQNGERNYKIGQFLHTIGKWSMADVFVAAILLALYALKYQQATKSIPCLGLYYFIGYCLVSLSTTQVLTGSGLVDGNEKKSRRPFGFGTIVGLLAALISFMAASGLYTYQQYTENTKENVEAHPSPQNLNNADLVLPVHKK